MPICSIQKLDCGCKIKRYHGGLIVREGCRKHATTKQYICPICGMELTEKRKLKAHKWEAHAI